MHIVAHLWYALKWLWLVRPSLYCWTERPVIKRVQRMTADIASSFVLVGVINRFSTTVLQNFQYRWFLHFKQQFTSFGYGSKLSFSCLIILSVCTIVTWFPRMRVSNIFIYLFFFFKGNEYIKNLFVKQWNLPKKSPLKFFCIRCLNSVVPKFSCMINTYTYS